MKKLRFISSLAFLGTMLCGCTFEYNYNVTPYPGSLNGNLGYEDTGVDDEGTYNDLVIWCDERIKSNIEGLMSRFIMNNSQKYKINYTINTTGEDSAASSMIENVKAGADIFIFAQDQLTRLKTAGALSMITGKMKTAITEESQEEAVEAATLNGKLYAFPFTSDNGYFMYYDKRIFPNEEDVSSIENIMAVLQREGKKISYPVFTNGWYSTSYFMATGCESNWEVNSKNEFIGYDDTYASDKGLVACRGLAALKQYESLFSTKDVADMKEGDTKVVISGVWDYEIAYSKMGDDLGCTKMPTFTVNTAPSGQPEKIETINISSYMGYKLVGVKPSSDEKRQSVCKKIARYISNEDAQRERFMAVNWGPTNISAAADEGVLSHPGLNALLAQKPYAKPQVSTPDNWFSNVSALAASISFGMSDSAMKEELNKYKNNLPSFLD